MSTPSNTNTATSESQASTERSLSPESPSPGRPRENVPYPTPPGSSLCSSRSSALHDRVDRPTLAPTALSADSFIPSFACRHVQVPSAPRGWRRPPPQGPYPRTRACRARGAGRASENLPEFVSRFSQIVHWDDTHNSLLSAWEGTLRRSCSTLIDSEVALCSRHPTPPPVAAKAYSGSPDRRSVVRLSSGVRPVGGPPLGEWDCASPVWNSREHPQPPSLAGGARFHQPSRLNPGQKARLGRANDDWIAHLKCRGADWWGGPLVAMSEPRLGGWSLGRRRDVADRQRPTVDGLHGRVALAEDVDQ